MDPSPTAIPRNWHLWLFFFRVEKVILLIFFLITAIFNTPLVPLSNLSAPSAAAAVIRASSTVGGPGGITAPPTNAGASAPPPLCPRPSNNDPLAVTSSPLMSASVSGRNRSVSPPSSAMGIIEKSASSAPHSPSPVGSSISKENNNSQQGGMPSPTYSQVSFTIYIFLNISFNRTAVCSKIWIKGNLGKSLKSTFYWIFLQTEWIPKSPVESRWCLNSEFFLAIDQWCLLPSQPQNIF